MDVSGNSDVVGDSSVGGDLNVTKQLNASSDVNAPVVNTDTIRTKNRATEISTDGISGLTKAFFQAGASDVIMSFWSVADKETSDLMQSFYLNSKKNGNQYANALRKSKLELIDKKMHPYYWAGFVINGL